jgi:hypothetical protein
VAPWNGPRHRSWASDTNLSLFMAALVVIAYVVWEIVGEAPQGMVTLVGVAGGALFGARTVDKKRREDEVSVKLDRVEATADRAEVKADRLVEVAESEHPDTAHATGLPEPQRHENEGDAP